MKLHQASRHTLWIAAMAVLGLGVVARAQAPQAVKAAEAAIDPEKIRAHVRFLSDDLLEGRGPGLRGSELAAKYIATQFALDGLEPGGDNGSYFQQVRFVGMKVKAADTSFAFLPFKGDKAGEAQRLSYGEDYTVTNQQGTAAVDVDAPIVFVGYGATAPEFGWDDYAGGDGK